MTLDIFPYATPDPSTVQVDPWHYWTGTDFAWRAGHWDYNHGGRVWVAGHWHRQHGRFHWVEGHWR